MTPPSDDRCAEETTVKPPYPPLYTLLLPALSQAKHSVRLPLPSVRGVRIPRRAYETTTEDRMTITTGTVRIIGWAGGLVLGASAFGMSWATQSVQVPLWAAFVLTFIPTSDLIDAVQDVLDAVTNRVTPDTNQE